ncbi:MAG TPA: AAA family ATPase, partial [Rhodobacteraceae bacterium]|nr:AAA family ATPase [Paracoccaceae bacterium]
MNMPSDQMELSEDAIRKHYDAASAMLTGFDHTPRIAKARDTEVKEKSAGLGTRRRFRSTTPGLVTRSTARPEGVQLLARIEAADDCDVIISPVQANVMSGLRRALAIALAVGEGFAEVTGLVALKKDNLQGSLAAGKKNEFAELLAAEAMAVLYTFANATSFLLAPHASEVSVEIGEVDEVLTDNALLALHGALWELDQDLATFADEEPKLIATVLAFAEQVMEKVALRAQNAPRLGAFTGASYKVEADDLTIAGFTPARAVKGSTLTMTFKKPNEVVGNHIAK